MPHRAPPIRPKPADAAPAAASRRVRRAEQANSRAESRAMVARFLNELIEQDEALSVNDLLTLYTAARNQQDPRVAGGPSLSRASLGRILIQVREIRAEGEAISTEQFRDRWGHRPVNQETNIVRDFAMETLLIRARSSIADVCDEVKAFAEERGYPPIPASTLKTLRGGMDRQALMASAFGKKAAEMDAMQKGTVPTRYPHDVWTLDETKLPVWIKVYDPVNKQLIARKADLVIIIDNNSRAIVGYWIVAASATLDAAEAAKAPDVIAALLGAALPELASPACREFAGFLPSTVRMDKAGAHKAVVELLERKNVFVPKLPAGTPFKRGMIERLIGSVKRLCSRIHGFEDAVTIAEYVTQSPAALRTVAAGKGERFPRRTLIATTDLLNLEELRTAFDGAVEAYHDRLHRILRQSPRGAYQLRLKPANARSGRDALTWEEPQLLTYQTTGFHRRHVDFVPALEQAAAFRVGQKYTVYPDPALRGLYVRVGAPGEERWLFCRRADQAARDPGAFEQQRYADVAEISDAVRTMVAAREDQQMAHRPGWRERAEDAARSAQAKARESRNKKKRDAEARRTRLQAAVIAEAEQVAAARKPSTPKSAPRKKVPGDQLAEKRAEKARAAASPTTPPMTFGRIKSFHDRD